MARATETPGQKLDREIAEKAALHARMARTIQNYSQRELEALYHVVHIRLHGDGEDD